jgi:DNA-binding NtrC family response regulator
MKILVADDEELKRVTLAHDLAAQGHEVLTVADGAAAMRTIEAEQFDVVITDLKMPHVDGLELLKCVKRNPLADTEVIIMTAYGSIPLAVEAGKLGAFDFLTKPFRNEDVLQLLARIEKERRAKTAAAAMETGKEPLEQMIVGCSPAIRRVRRLIEISARCDANVLLCGETGVGKDLVAGAIHRTSPRRRFPLVKVSCPLFPSQLIESELYGHEKGSFTGADQRRPGRFELAQGGTLYLDDVDDIPPEHQAKLLRVIEEKVFERVGGTTPIHADVRIIASTKRNLLEKVSQGSFRQDLYYRLDVLRVNIPPLRERRADIPLLAEHLLGRIAQGRPARLEPAALNALEEHDWPGNVRELFHLLQRLFLTSGGVITATLVQEETTTARKPSPAPYSGAFHDVIEQTERELLRQALAAAGGNKTAAAAALGMKPSTFRDKLAKYGLG